MGLNTDELYFKPKMRVIDDNQIAQIHMATLEVLERTGIKVTQPLALELLTGNGARVNGDRVRLPSWMVEKAIQSAPSRLVLGRRDGRRTVLLERDKSYFGPSLDCLDYLEPDTHTRRRFGIDDLKATAALCDGLPNFDWCMTIGLAEDRPADIADRVVARYTMECCEKPMVFCCKDANSVKDIYEMALLIRGGKEAFEQAPSIVHYSEPISPLVFYDPAVDKILFCAEHNIPLINFPAPQACGSAPATLAGTVIQGSAESLAGLVIHQLMNPGAPFIYGAFTTIMDMKTSIFSYGACEMTIMVGALAQMAQYYGLPFFGTAGASDAKFSDAQAGIEATFQCLAAAAIGSGLVHDCSSWLDHGNLVSPEFMVMADEILGNVRQFMNGLPVTAETLALDLIDEIGPGGNYLQTEHTLKHFREIRYSPLFDRTVQAKWEKAGSRKFEQRLSELTLEKMKHQPVPLPAEVVAELDRMQKKWK